jgi:hypothetical protein
VSTKRSCRTSSGTRENHQYMSQSSSRLQQSWENTSRTAAPHSALDFLALLDHLGLQRCKAFVRESRRFLSAR